MREITIPAPIVLKNLATGLPLLKINRAGDKALDEPDDPMTMHRFVTSFLLGDPKFSDKDHGNKVKALRAADKLSRAFPTMWLDGLRVRLEEDHWERGRDVIEKSEQFAKQNDAILCQCLPFIDAWLEAKEVKDVSAP